VTAPRPTILQVLNGEKPANSPGVRVESVPGSKFNYSGGGVIVSQLLLSDVTGEAYDRWMRRNVLDPIGMRDRSFRNPPPHSRIQFTATGYRGDGREVEGRWHIYPEIAAAGLWTTPTDLR
jgi:CubicO group peptidase (beta-lactamase class C family)